MKGWIQHKVFGGYITWSPHYIAKYSFWQMYHIYTEHFNKLKKKKYSETQIYNESQIIQLLLLALNQIIWDRQKLSIFESLNDRITLKKLLNIQKFM